MPESPADTEKTREEHEKRIYVQYESNARTLRNLVSGLLIFTLGFFFVILLPYILAKRENSLIRDRLKSLPAEIESLKKQSAPYLAVQSAVQRLNDEIKRGPQELRSFILSGGTSGGEEGQQSMASQSNRSNMPNMAAQSNMANMSNIAVPADPCRHLPQEEQLGCRVRIKVLNQFQRYKRILVFEIIQPTRGLQDSAAAIESETALNDQLASLEESLKRKLDEQPQFWHTYGGKEGMFGEVGSVMTPFWEKYRSIIDSRTAALTQAMKSLEEAKSSLEQRETQLKDQGKRLSERLSQIEFPFGKLPIGLEESVAFFPVLLTIGFLICAALFRETIRLRKAFHDLYQRHDPGGTIISNEQVALVAPLWIEPLRSRRTQRAKIALSAVPLFVYVLSTALIVYGWTIADEQRIPLIQLVIFGIIYAISGAMLWIASSRAVQAVRAYG